MLRLAKTKVSVCLFFTPASILVCVHNTKFAASQKQVIDQIINNSLIVSFVRVRERDRVFVCARERCRCPKGFESNLNAIVFNQFETGSILKRDPSLDVESPS